MGIRESKVESRVEVDCGVILLSCRGWWNPNIFKIAPELQQLSKTSAELSIGDVYQLDC